MQDTRENPEYYRQRQRPRRPRYQLQDRQTFVDILGTVLRYVLIIVLIMVIIRVSRDAYNIGYEVFSNEAMALKGQGQDVTITITQDMSDQEVGTLLQNNGLIKDARVFPLQVRFSSDGSIAPGTYTLSTEMTTDEILNEITSNTEAESDDSSTSESTAASGSTSSDDAATSAASQ